jgi:macrodomain Ter protein organizer (MatP/YcbG family)
MMKTLIALLLLAGSAVAGDLRNIAGAVVDLSPIYQWSQTNGPATNRPLSAWKWMQVVQIGKTISVYVECEVAIDGVTNVIFTDHLPDPIKTFLDEEQRLELQNGQMQSFIENETKRLRLVAVESANWDSGSRAYNQFLLDRANLDNKKDDLTKTKQKLAEMKAGESSNAADFAILMNKKYLNLEIWDFGLKRP